MERNYVLDKMKFFCIIAVVCIHTVPFDGTNLGWIINTLCRSAVPLFFICSGYLFYSKFSYGYMKKYFFKITKLFFSWSIFYIILGLGLASISNIKDSISLLDGIKEYFSGFNLLNLYYANGIIKYHLWYLSATIVIIPILYFVIKNNCINKAVIVAFILNVLGVFIYNIGFKYIETTRDALFFGLLYILLGTYIKSNEERIKYKMKKIKNINIVLLIISIIVTFSERYIYDIYFNKTSDYFIATIPLSLLIFIMCILKNDSKSNIISKIGRNSIGVYVIHIAVMEIINIVLFRLGLFNIKESIIGQLLYTPIIIIISYMGYMAIQYIKNNYFRDLKRKKGELISLDWY
jgi:surface polysaccharide O-acyltransferase-like enzyme